MTKYNTTTAAFFRPNGCERQCGAALIISLLFLLLTTLTGVSIMQTDILEERMTGNLADQSIAFQASEAAVSDGVDWLGSLITEPVADASGSDGVWLLHSHSKKFIDPSFPWATDGNAYGTFSHTAPLPGLAEQPAWIVEQEGVVPDDLSGALREGRSRYFYRITTHGVGATQSARSVVQATIAKRYR